MSGHMSRFLNTASRDSSLCVSALSSPLATARTSVASTDDIGDDTIRTHKGTVMAKIEVSELFAPLEARLSARLEAIEMMLESRCSSLEAKVGVLAGTAAGEAAGFQEHLQVLQEQMEQTTASLQAYLLKETSKLAELSDGVRSTIDKQATLQSNIDDVWRQVKGDRHTLQTSVDDVWQQLKADRQESVAKYGKLSDTVELRLRSLLNKVDLSCSSLSGMLAEDITPAHKDVADYGVAESRSSLARVAEGAHAEPQLPSLLGSRSASQHALRRTGAGTGGPQMGSPKVQQGCQGRSPSPPVQPAGGHSPQALGESGLVASKPLQPSTPSVMAARNMQTLQSLQQPGTPGQVHRMTQQQIPRMTSDSSRGGGGCYGLRRSGTQPISRSYQQLPQAGGLKGSPSPLMGTR